MSGTYKPNDAGLTALINGPEIGAALEAITEKAKGIATGLAEDFRITGEYIDGLKTSVAVEPVKKGPARLVGRLNATAAYSASVEWGAEHGPVGTSKDPAPSAHHVLKRTLDSLGG